MPPIHPVLLALLRAQPGGLPWPPPPPLPLQAGPGHVPVAPSYPMGFPYFPPKPGRSMPAQLAHPDQVAQGAWLIGRILAGMGAPHLP